MKGGLYQAKQSIEAKNYEHPTGTLAMILHKPAGGANPYVRFVYGPQKKFNHTQGQVLLSINTDPNNANKQVNNQRRKYYC